MKPRECAKYVYRQMSDGYYYRLFNGELKHMDFEFENVRLFFERLQCKKVSFLWHGSEALAWRDKHGNIIVRVHHADTQTKLFEDV